MRPAGAASANISHSFDASSGIANGSLVSLDSSKSNYVEPANTSNGQDLLGVAVSSGDSLIAIDPAPGTIQVATTGDVDTLVSTLNGPVAVGDQVSVSPFDGVGMKAGQGDEIIGLAQTAFNSSTNGGAIESVKNKNGKISQIYVGYVRAGISIGVGSVTGTNDQLGGLQKLAQGITGHVVSTARIVISLIVATIATLALITLIYASIYGGIISIGRNPLAKRAVFRSLITVLWMVVLIATVASGIIYLLLK
jgi:hypothetical protein